MHLMWFHNLTAINTPAYFAINKHLVQLVDKNRLVLVDKLNPLPTNGTSPFFFHKPEQIIYMGDISTEFQLGKQDGLCMGD